MGIRMYLSRCLKSGSVTGLPTDLLSHPALIYAVLELDGKLQVLRGAAYDDYEFTVPIAKRMTDEEWRAALDAGTQPLGAATARTSTR